MNRIITIALALFLSAGARSLGAQQINPRVPPPPPPPAATQPAAAPATAPTSSAAPIAATEPSSSASHPIDPSIPPPPPSEDSAPETSSGPSQPVFDPLHAQRSLDVGTFYLNKGSYDAAIDRFLEASNYQPGLAMPWKMLGEAYEKKHEYAKAGEAYNKYMQLDPRAADAAKIRKTISELADKSAQESSKNK